MSEAIEAPSATRLLEGVLTKDQLKAQLGWGDRTVQRREAEGLPFIKIGGDRLYPIDKVRAWILSHTREQSPAVSRGRPRKAA